MLNRNTNCCLQIETTNSILTRRMNDDKHQVSNRNNTRRKHDKKKKSMTNNILSKETVHKTRNTAKLQTTNNKPLYIYMITYEQTQKTNTIPTNTNKRKLRTCTCAQGKFQRDDRDNNDTNDVAVVFKLKLPTPY